MQYREDKKSGNKLSVLSLGCMRLPSSSAKSEAVIMEAINNGINFFDTAYLYTGSEAALGHALHKNNVRDKVYIGTKLPPYLCRKYDDFDKFFNRQLERLKTDYIDYYFIHSLFSEADWERLCSMGIEQWLHEKKTQGKIKQIGFSFHGPRDSFNAIIDAYDWDFCMIQYNYINTHYQAGVEGLRYAHSKGMPVFVMSPLLGGRLSDDLPKRALALLREKNPNTIEWAFRWLWNQPEVTLILSGMSTVEQVKNNAALVEKAQVNGMSSEELAIINQIVDIFSESYKIPCTACNYCLPCPAKINIPDCFMAYNASYAINFVTGMKQYVMSMGISSSKYVSVSSCNKCGKCEKSCPQGIAIMERLKDVRKRMEPFWFKIIVSIVKKFLK